MIEYLTPKVKWSKSKISSNIYCVLLGDPRIPCLKNNTYFVVKGKPAYNEELGEYNKT